MRREIIVSFGRDPTAQRPCLLKRIILGIAIVVVAVAMLLAALVLGLSLMLIIWAMVAIAIIVAVLRSLFSRPNRF